MMNPIRLMTKITSIGCIEMFVGALTKSVFSEVAGGKAARIGATVGAVILGVYTGDKVSDYICDMVETIAKRFETEKPQEEQTEVQK